MKYLLTAILLAFSITAQAGLVACNQLTEDAVPDSMCELGLVNNDFLNPLQVNIDEMFGFTDWEFEMKHDFVGEIFGGTVDFSAYSSFDDVMFVLKDGNGIPDTYVGYLLDDPGVFSYTSPFVNPSNGDLKAISHWSLYVRGDGGGGIDCEDGGTCDVPEPGTLLIFLTAMVGMVGRKYLS